MTYVIQGPRANKGSQSTGRRALVSIIEHILKGRSVHEMGPGASPYSRIKCGSKVPVCIWRLPIAQPGNTRSLEDFRDIILAKQCEARASVVVRRGLSNAIIRDI